MAASRRPGATDDEMDLLVEQAKFQAAATSHPPAARVTLVGRAAAPPPPPSSTALGGHLAAPAHAGGVPGAPLDLVGNVVERAVTGGSRAGASRPVPVPGTPFPRAQHRRESKFSLARRGAAPDAPVPPHPPPLDEAVLDAVDAAGTAPPATASTPSDTAACMLAAMTPAQVAAARAELEARLPPRAADFLRRRGEKKVASMMEGKLAASKEALTSAGTASTKPAPPSATAPAHASAPSSSTRFDLDATPIGTVPPDTPPADALQRDPLRSDATALGYSVAEAAALARSALPAQRAAGVALLARVAARARQGGGVGVGGAGPPAERWSDVLDAARATATRPLVAAVGDTASVVAVGDALRGLMALLAPAEDGADTAAVWAAAAAVAPVRVARRVASRPHPVGAWVVWDADAVRQQADDDDGGGDDTLFQRDPLAAAFQVGGLGPALARVLQTAGGALSGHPTGDAVLALRLVAAAGAAGGAPAAAAAGACAAAAAALAGDPDADIDVRVAAFDALTALCAGGGLGTRGGATTSAAAAAAVTAAVAAAVSTSMAALGGLHPALATPSLATYTALVQREHPCLRLDDALAGLAPGLFDARTDARTAAAALRLAAAAVAARSDGAASPACAATVALEATWVLDGEAVESVAAAWARGDVWPAARLAAAARLMAAALVVGGHTAAANTPLRARVAAALAASGLAAPGGDDDGGSGVIGAALDAVAGTMVGLPHAHVDDLLRAIAAADVVTAVLQLAAAACGPAVARAVAAAAWAALAPATLTAVATAAPAAVVEWTTDDAAAAQVRACGVGVLLAAAEVLAVADTAAATGAPPNGLATDPLLAAFRMLPPGADAIGVRALACAFSPHALASVASASDAAIGALAASSSPLATAARGGADGPFNEPGMTDAAVLGGKLLATYARAWCGFAIVPGAGGGGQGAGAAAPASFVAAAGSRLPPPVDWMLADCGEVGDDGTGGGDGGAQSSSSRRVSPSFTAASSALTLFLGLEAGRSPLPTLANPADRLPLLLDVALASPAAPWREPRARWALAALLKRGVAPPATMTPAAASRAATAYAADTYGDPLVGGMVARVLLPGSATAAVGAALDALDDGDALWSLPPIGDVEGVGAVSDEVGGRLARALAGGRLMRGVVVAPERDRTPCLAAVALDWVVGHCFCWGEGGDKQTASSLLRSFVATAPVDALAAVLAWGGRGGVASRVAQAKAAAGGHADVLAKVEEAVNRVGGSEIGG